MHYLTVTAPLAPPARAGKPRWVRVQPSGAVVRKTVRFLFLSALLLVLPDGPRADDVPVLYWNTEAATTLRAHIAPDADFWRLMPTFTLQQTQTLCGVASAVMALNAMDLQKPVDVDYWPYPYFTQSNYFTAAVTEVITQQTAISNGVSRELLAETLRRHGVSVASVDGVALGEDALRNLLREALGDDGRFVLANFLRTALGQDGGGHWSPLVAYDEESDRVLVLDVAKYKYPPAWVRIDALRRAIATVDPTNRESRGLLIVSEPR